MPEQPEPAAPTFRLLVVPGVIPASWLRTWAERLPAVRLDLVHAEVAAQHATLVEGAADAALLRLPVDRDVLSAIPLYVETTVVVLPKDHLLTALDEIAPADLVEETLLVPADDVLPWPDRPGEESALPTPETTADAVELVAAGVGLLVVPQSLARLHHRRDLTYRPLTDAPTSQVALGWLRDRDGDPMIEEMIGIVRGRTVNSSRGAAGAGRGATADAGKKSADRRPAPARGASAGRGGTRAQGDRRGSGSGASGGRRGGGGRRRGR